jgi:predicted NUDIX family NTP pyrophosphohydrolase
MKCLGHGASQAPTVRSSRKRLAQFTAVLLAIGAMAPTGAYALSFAGPTNYNVGNSPVSVDVGNFNGDSDPDLVVANELSNDVSVLLGGAADTFTGPTNFAVGNAPQGIAVGDFNGDSDPDLAVVNEFSYDVSVLLGGAGGAFTGPANFPVGIRPLAIAAGEFNGDSDPDLAVVNESDNTVSVLIGGAGGTFSAPTNFPVGVTPQSVVVGDFNRDSDPDLAVANGGSNDVSVLLGGAGATFSAPTNFAAGFFPISVEVKDFNGDSDLDLAVVNEASNDVSVLLGGTAASFGAPTNLAVGTGPQSVALAEFNGDSDPDMAVANELSSNVSVLLGGPAMSFTGASTFTAGSLPSSIAFGRFNGDSFDDLAVANQASNTVSILFRAVDTTPPETTIDSGPSGPTNDATPTFTFSSNEATSTFRCRVDSGAFAACSSPHTTATLSTGAHTFEVRATDDSGNTDLTAAARPFTVDTAAPSAPVLSATIPSSPANDNSPKVMGTAEAGSTVTLYRAPSAADCMPANLLAADTAAALASPGIAVVVPDNSTTTLRAVATDAAGNASGCSFSVVYAEVSPPGSGPPGGAGPGGGGPPAGGGAPDTSAPAIAFTAKAVRMQPSGVVTMRLSCPASETEGCEGTVVLEARVRRQKVTLGKSSFRIAGAASARVQIRLSKKTQRLVRKRKRLSVYAVINAHDRVGNARTTKRALTLRSR